MAAFATRFCLRHCVFLCKGTKLQNSAKPNSRTVCRFSPWNVFPPMKPAVWGFGLGLLGGQGFIGAKPVIPTNVLAAFAISFCQRHCVSLCKGTKLQKAVLFAIVRRSFMEESCFCFWKSKANSTFYKVVKQKGEACFCVW